MICQTKGLLNFNNNFQAKSYRYADPEAILTESVKLVSCFVIIE